jgi:hypothetical protein
MKRGERDRAAALLAESSKESHAALGNGNESQRVPVDIAAIHAVKGETDQALEWLERGIAAGYTDYSTLGRHPIFASLQREARFQELLQRMEQAVARMRERSTVLSELRVMPFPPTAGAR